MTDFEYSGENVHTGVQSIFSVHCVTVPYPECNGM